MKLTNLACIILFSPPLLANPEPQIAAEWQRLREELRKQGYPVAARVETQREIAADMVRVRREMERRAGRPRVSDMQRVGGGGGPPAANQNRGPVRLQPANGLRR